MRTIAALFCEVDQAERAVDRLQEQGYGPQEVGILARDRTLSARLAPEDRDRDTLADDIEEAGVVGAGVNWMGGMLTGVYPASYPGLGAALAAGALMASRQERREQEEGDVPRTTPGSIFDVDAEAGRSNTIDAEEEEEIGQHIERSRRREAAVEMEARAARERATAETRERLDLEERLRGFGVSDERISDLLEGVKRGGVLLTVTASDDQADEVAQLLDDAGACDLEERKLRWRESGWTHFDRAQEPGEDYPEI